MAEFSLVKYAHKIYYYEHIMKRNAACN